MPLFKQQFEVNDAHDYQIICQNCRDTLFWLNQIQYWLTISQPQRIQQKSENYILPFSNLSPSTLQIVASQSIFQSSVDPNVTFSGKKACCCSCDKQIGFLVIAVSAPAKQIKSDTLILELSKVIITKDDNIYNQSLAKVFQKQAHFQTQQQHQSDYQHQSEQKPQSEQLSHNQSRRQIPNSLNFRRSTQKQFSKVAQRESHGQVKQSNTQYLKLKRELHEECKAKCSEIEIQQMIKVMQLLGKTQDYIQKRVQRVQQSARQLTDKINQIYRTHKAN